ncbi:peptide/nickel transport system ATP-binding protein [Propionibacteriaceae bacterium ES.041]|uniref:dipeptide ABC transporter ATP-binding protein n=1 Tax=Enemella evansiae TaxID=2016499 RepID=UPI000B976B5F|nr:ABC transporter ATP-binding protein [Enemella evansiae]OYN99330.1 glutathione ABC transporter ATP-binding protein [Enemella evansiae]PFG67096.1 peptide/nickel transport system ATP-binding protein [Propionibacteriaceae bacterium ES.041]
MSADVLRVRDLRIRFGDSDTAAVDGVSFDLARGEVLAMVGESGSGKTITGQAILGLLPSSARATGSIELAADDEPAMELLAGSGVDWRAVRGRRVAMIFQEPQTALNPVRTIGWQLTEAIRAHRPVGRRAASHRASELLKTVGLPEPARLAAAYPHQLSGGQKQRVVIALALASDPAVLIADEPTTALDVTVQAEILALLAELRDRLDTGVLLITHNMGVVAELADRVLVLRSGQLVETGAVVPLFESPEHGYTRSLLSAVPRLPIDQGPVESVTEPTDTEPPIVAYREVSIDHTGRWGRTPVRAVSGVSLTVPRGRVLGVVGESGSGKTTLARAALGAIPVAAGQVLVTGTDLARTTGAARRGLLRRIGVVHQDPASTLDPLLSVGDSIAEPIQVHRALPPRAARKRVAELLEQVSLPAAFAARRPHELSGGQRQRVALARALALGPELLIADEPTSALDATVQASVLALFQRLQQELGFACLFISHDLAVVGEVSDEVLVLRGGSVVEHGPARGVLTRPEQPYTRALLDAVPLPDPIAQRSRLRRTA